MHDTPWQEGVLLAGMKDLLFESTLFGLHALKPLQNYSMHCSGAHDFGLPDVVEMIHTQTERFEGLHCPIAVNPC